MRKGGIWWGVGACALVVVGCITAGLSARPAPLAPPQRLPDGSVLTPLGFTLGTTTHRWAVGNTFQRTVLNVAPSGLRQLVGGWVEEFSTRSPDTPVLWLRHTGNSSSSSHQVVVVDADGCEFEQSGVTFSGTAPDEMIALPISAWARKDPRVTVRLYTYQPNGKKRQDAEFIVPNPVRGSYPIWRAEPFPVTRSDGDLTITLASVLTRVAPSGAAGPPPNPDEPWTRLRFRERENGHPSNAWGMAAVEAQDGTGNLMRSQSSITRFERDSTEHAVRLALCPREIWKLRCEFTRSSGFSPQELCTVSGILLPSKEGSTAIGQRRRMQGANIEMVKLVGANVKMVELGGANVGSKENIGWQGSPWLHLKTMGLPEDVRISLLSVRDQSGRELHRGGSSWNGEGQHSFAFDPAPGSRSVTITLAVHRSKFLEFTVRPELPGAGNERKDLK